jgi:integrase
LTDDNRTWLLSFVSGQKFFNSKLKDSKDTEENYTSHLKQYCDDVGKNPDQLLKLKPTTFELLAMMQKGIDVSTLSETAAKDTLETYLAKETIYDKETNENKPFTVYSKIGFRTAVKSFYSANDRDLPKSTAENLEAPEAKKRTPSVEDCVKLENNMTNRRDKFLIWFLESCPVRKATLFKLKWKDLKPLNDKNVPYWLNIESARLKGSGKGKYKGTKHIGFLHSYAVEKLDDYKKELKERGINYNEDSPLFMCYYGNAYGSRVGDALKQINSIFLDASIVAFGDDIKKHFSPHDFRDILSTVLEKPQVKANVNLAKPLTSHKPTGIEATYANHSSTEDKPNEDQLTVFKMCLPFLIPETTEELKAELNQQKAETEKINLENTKVIAVQQVKIEEQNKKVKEMEEKFDEKLNAKTNELKMEIMSKMELFKLVETKEEWEKTQEFFNTLRTAKIERQIQKQAEEQDKYEQENKPNELTTEQQEKVKRRIEQYRKQQEEKSF